METWKMAQDIEKQTTFENEKKEIDEREIYRQALEKWGWLQKIVAIEEMSELQKELCKNLRGRLGVYAIAEEIADVEIMLEQMKLLFNIENDVNGWKEEKLKRLAKRLGEEKND